RRHTISKRDWSADACSSDLKGFSGASMTDVDHEFGLRRVVAVARTRRQSRLFDDIGHRGPAEALARKARQRGVLDPPTHRLLVRSEERRVGNAKASTLGLMT